MCFCFYSCLFLLTRFRLRLRLGRPSQAIFNRQHVSLLHGNGVHDARKLELARVPCPCGAPGERYQCRRSINVFNGCVRSFAATLRSTGDSPQRWKLSVDEVCPVDHAPGKLSCSIRVCRESESKSARRRRNQLSYDWNDEFLSCQLFYGRDAAMLILNHFVLKLFRGMSEECSCGG